MPLPLLSSQTRLPIEPGGATGDVANQYIGSCRFAEAKVESVIVLSSTASCVGDCGYTTDHGRIAVTGIENGTVAVGGTTHRLRIGCRQAIASQCILVGINGDLIGSHRLEIGKVVVAIDASNR